MTLEARILELIRTIPDYPKPGILFRDITPLLRDSAMVKETVARMAAPFQEAPPDFIAAIEARGFIFGVLLAQYLNCGFIPVRKSGKLPGKVLSVSYALEYGEATMEMQHDAFPADSKVVIHDDVLATGGTALAAGNLVKAGSGVISGFSFLIELTEIAGHARLKNEFNQPIDSLLRF